MRIGILGGGQLGRMLALAGYPLGVRFRHLGTAQDTSAREVIKGVALGCMFAPAVVVQDYRCAGY